MNLDAILAAVQKGDLDAKSELQDLIFEKRLTGSEKADVVRWLTDKSAAGSPEATYLLGCTYEGVDDALAFKHQLASAKAGYEFAYYTVAEKLKEGCGTPKDYAQAVQWYSRASEAGESMADDELGARLDGDIDAAANLGWWTAVAEAGITRVQFALACHYNHGKAKSIENVVHWYTKAAELGHREAQAALGECYATGTGMAKDFQQAVLWLERAIAQGHEYALYQLAAIHADQESGFYDMSKAAALWQKLSDLGDEDDYCVRAAFELSWCYALGVGVEQDVEQAFKVLPSILYPGWPRLLHEQTWWKHRIEDRDKDALYWLGSCHEYYSNGASFDAYLQAAEQGHSEAQYVVGNCLYNGRSGLPRNPVEGLKWLTLAAAAGSADAASTLSKIRGDSHRSRQA